MSQLDKMLKDIPERIDIHAWKVMCSTTHCYMCKGKKDLGEPMILAEPGKFSIPKLSGIWLFHLYDSHGQPPQWTIGLWVDRIFKKEAERKAYRKLWGYDREVKGVAA